MAFKIVQNVLNVDNTITLVIRAISSLQLKGENKNISKRNESYQYNMNYMGIQLINLIASNPNLQVPCFLEST